MAHLAVIGVHEVTADDKVERQTVGGKGDTFEVLHLPGRVCFYFDGNGSGSEQNLLGFLDQMHSIRNALLQDMADRAKAVK